MGFFSFVTQGQDVHKLRVGISGGEPFVMDSTGTAGISVEIWKEIAENLDTGYDKIFYESIPEGIEAVQAGKIDILVGPVSITSERAQTVKFTQPYFQSSLSILSRTDSLSFWSRLKPFFSKKFFIAICIFILILTLVGALLWLAERKKNEAQFPAKPSKGIPNGMWCAIVTMTTTGYGDIAPVTFWGRFIASSWMIISLLSATTMVAGIASTLTLGGLQVTTISKAEGLRNRSIGVVKGSPAEDFVEEYRGRIVHIENIDQGYELLKDKKIDAIVYDRPQLQYFTNEHEDKSVAVSLAEYEKQGYGFALPMNTTLQPKLNVQLLQLKESGDIATIVRKWLGDSDK